MIRAQETEKAAEEMSLAAERLRSINQAVKLNTLKNKSVQKKYYDERISKVCQRTEKLRAGQVILLYNSRKRRDSLLTRTLAHTKSRKLMEKPFIWKAEENTKGAS